MELELLPNGQVLKVITDGQTIEKTHYCMEKKIELSTDKITIAADGVDFATITATIKNYLGEQQTDEIDVYFSVNGLAVGIEKAVGGVASIEVDSSVAGDIVIKTLVAGMDNSEVTIHAE